MLIASHGRSPYCVYVAQGAPDSAVYAAEELCRYLRRVTGALMPLLREKPPVDTWFAFTVQEEQGLRGAAAAAYRIRPDVAIVVEGTTACDLPDLPPHMQVCVPGRGPVMPVMDGATLYNPALIRRAFEIAEKHGIPYQTKSYIAGGTDAGRITQTAGGAAAIGVAAAVRYIHTPSSAMDVSDLGAMRTLVRALMEEI